MRLDKMCMSNYKEMAAFFWSDGFENDKFKSVPLVHLPIINRLREELGGDYSCYRKTEVENRHNSLLFSACQGRQTSQCLFSSLECQYILNKS